MALATVCFHPDGDAAAIFWDTRPNDDPVDAWNQALEVLQSPVSCPTLYFYKIYNGDLHEGWLIAGNFNPDPGFLGDAERRKYFDEIVDQHRDAPLGGDLAPIYVQA